MKKAFIFLAAALLLTACAPEETVSETSSPEVVSEETSAACEHVYGDTPVETVGNLEIYECSLCGEQKVVANGTLIGGEENP